ncbi:MAG TPA: hypothetical protein VH008_34200 [Pseudonocardia sp.]|jgi:YVTN family beta-propeller protein|nr:hypothetical protein [Pseudonocardia sp.]
MTVSPDGTRLYVATATEVSVIDTSTNVVLGGTPAGVGATGLAVSPSGRYLFLSGDADHAVHVYDVGGEGAPREVGGSGDVGEAPDHLTMAPDGGHLYLSGHGGLTTVDTSRFR